MADIKIESNMYFINAPAGSGKTHFIKDRVNIIVDKDPSARILCITYTDRAAKELKARILSDGVYISTIHSFINFFISPYFAHSEAIEMYFELYKNDIENRIMENNSVDILDLQNKNSKYLISKGFDPSKISISIDIIKENTTSIYYNERSYNTLYYGGLSHDNLLHFTFSFLDKYPVLQLRLREMFQYIFVDEVQDTNTKILSMFYNAVKSTSTKLYYFGDKMQEIYDNYDGEFEKEYKTFDSSLSKEFIFNYRSSSEIVNVLTATLTTFQKRQMHVLFWTCIRMYTPNKKANILKPSDFNTLIGFNAISINRLLPFCAYPTKFKMFCIIFWTYFKNSLHQ